MNIKTTIDNNREQLLSNEFRHYWKTNKENTSQAIQQVSYSDILSMLKLNEVNGVLMFKNTKDNSELPAITKQVSFAENETEHETKPIKNAKPVNIPMPQEITNSYIYDKFFKKYKTADVIETPQVPLTKYEYIKNQIKKHNERIAAQKRIEQIKSKKLLFLSGNNTVNNTVNNIVNNTTNSKNNKLFRF